jgi:ABC-type antimicrobial peptide transport system permease subunit
LQSESDEGFISVFDLVIHLGISIGGANTPVPENGYKKIKLIKDIQGMEFIGAAPDEDAVGVFLSEKQFEFLVGKKASEDNVNELLTALSSLERVYFLNNSNYLQKGTISGGSSFRIRGVYKSDGGAYTENKTIDEDTTILAYYSGGGTTLAINADFRKLYLLMGGDWKVNEELLSAFVMPDMGEEFYIANPEYKEYDFTDYTPYSYIVYKAEDYLVGVKEMGVKYKNYLVVAGALGICIFTFASIKKHKYKIGVLKSFGIRNGDIALIFGIESFIIALAAFFASIPFSSALMSEINHEFTANYSFGVVFFTLSFNDFLTTFLLSIGLVLASLAPPLIKIFLTAPINIIKR